MTHLRIIVLPRVPLLPEPPHITAERPDERAASEQNEGCGKELHEDRKLERDQGAHLDDGDDFSAKPLWEWSSKPRRKTSRQYEEVAGEKQQEGNEADRAHQNGVQSQGGGEGRVDFHIQPGTKRRDSSLAPGEVSIDSVQGKSKKCHDEKHPGRAGLDKWGNQTGNESQAPEGDAVADTEGGVWKPLSKKPPGETSSERISQR